MTQHKNIYIALSAAQAQMGPVVKGAENPHFKSKYADLADVMAVATPALNANGIAPWHSVIYDDGRTMMRTTLSHGESDTHISCDVPLIVQKQDMQGMKSATTYAKRIGIESLTGIAPEDDDGNAAAKAAPKDNGFTVSNVPWHEEVLKDLPEGATDRDKAKALSDALIAQFKRKKSAGELSNEWDRRAKVIERIEAIAPDLHEAIVDAYESRVMGLGEKD